MSWLVPALLTAFFVGTQDAWVKRYFSTCNVFEMAAYPMVYSLPFLLAFLISITVPPLDYVFFVSFLVSLPLNGLCFLLYMRAIQISPLSLTLPYLAFTPVFMLLTGLLFLGELPGAWGIVGILLIVFGGYVIHLDPEKFGLLAPLRAMGREPGSLIMMLVAFLFSFAAVIAKIGILHSTPIFFALSFFGVHNLVVPLCLLLFGKIRIRRLLDLPGKGLVAGLLLCGHVLFHCLAIVLTKAVYMIAVKRLSILVGVIYGRIWFQENDFRQRLLGATMMIAGSGLILILGR